MSHVNDMHTWMTAEDFEHCERVLHRKGGDAAYHAEVYCIRKRRAAMRAAEKAERERMQVPLFAIVLLVMAMLGCAPAHMRCFAGGVELACATGTIADLAGAEWGSVLELIACRLAKMAKARVARSGGTESTCGVVGPADADLETAVVDAAEDELRAALEACDPEPTPEQRARAIAALVEAAP